MFEGKKGECDRVGENIIIYITGVNVFETVGGE